MSLDHMVHAALLRVLEQGATVLSIGIPGGRLPWTVEAIRPDLQLLRALPEELLGRFPDLAGNLDALQTPVSRAEILGRETGDLLISPLRTLGDGTVFAGQRMIRCTGIAEYLSRFKSLGLLHFGAMESTTDLLLPALGNLAGTATITLVDLASPTAAQDMRRILAALPGTDLAIWGLSRRGGVARLDGSEASADFTGLILASKTFWIAFGLTRLAEATTADAYRRALALEALLPASSKLGDLALSRLATARPVQTLPVLPEKMFLSAGRDLLVRGAEAIPHSEGTWCLRSLAEMRLELVFVPPTAGVFRYGITLSEPPSRGLTENLWDVSTVPGEPMMWHSEWWQLRSTGVHEASRPAQPLVIPLMQRGAGKGVGISCTIRGIELEYLTPETPWPGTAPVGCGYITKDMKCS